MKYILTDKKSNPDGTIRDQVIETHGYIPTFTMDQLEDNMRFNEKALKELTAQVGYEEAVMKNVVTNHPFVADLSDADRRAVHMYEEAFTMRKQCNVKIEELNATIEKDNQRIEDLKEQIPQLFETPETPSEDSVEDQPTPVSAEDEIIPNAETSTEE